VSTRRGSGERVLRPGTAVVLGRDGGLFASGTVHAAPGYHRSVSTPRRPAAVLRVLLFVTSAALVTACGVGGVPTPAASRLAASSPASPRPSLTAVPGGPASPVVGASVGLPTTTKTDFGTIFDALPPSFPKLPGEEPATTGSGASSGSFAVNVGASAASAAIKSGLEALGWTVDVGSPLEDGSVVLEGSRGTSGCKAEVRFTPVSGTVIMTVLYGASCPFN
jgi:hypothetical protein